MCRRLIRRVLGRRPILPEPRYEPHRRDRSTVAKSVLVISNSNDDHANLVIPALRRRGVDVIRIDTPKIVAGTHLETSIIEGTIETRVRTDEYSGDLTDVRSAWYRRPELPSFTELPPEHQVFARAETAAALQSLWRLIDCLWISLPNRIATAGRKLVQLRAAASLGFEIPRTLMTNRADAVRDFADATGGSFIYKTMAQPAIEYSTGEVGAIYTSMVTAAHMTEVDRVALVPCLFQEYIPKEFEVRVTVFGSRLFAAAIHSQSSERSRADWRRYDASVAYTPLGLPKEVETRCVDLVSAFGLQFGAIDLIMTPDGRWVFLEINPNGQWGWIEDLTAMPLTEALCDILVDGPDDPTLLAPARPLPIC